MKLINGKYTENEVEYNFIEDDTNCCEKCNFIEATLGDCYNHRMDLCAGTTKTPSGYFIKVSITQDSRLLTCPKCNYSNIEIDNHINHLYKCPKCDFIW